MYSKLLSDGSLYRFLDRCDEELAAEARAGGCLACGGVVHSARYPRKPRGGPPESCPTLRASFCCGGKAHGCRQRLTPPSLRFLGRKVYLGATIVLVTAMMHGVTGARVRRLAELVGASARTLRRWQTWWRETVPAGPFWRALAGRLATPVVTRELPVSLLARIAGDEREQLVGVLRLLLPITTQSARSSMAL